MTARDEKAAPYITKLKRDLAAGGAMPEADNQIINQALMILDEQFRARQDIKFTQPEHLKSWLRLEYHGKPYEVFGILLLDNQHCLIERVEVSKGTLDNAAVHPREIVREALAYNAAAMILYHNHPSGQPEPSQSDQAITDRIVSAMNLVDVRVLDHIVVGTGGSVSFAERGLL